MEPIVAVALGLSRSFTITVGAVTLVTLGIGVVGYVVGGGRKSRLGTLQLARTPEEAHKALDDAGPAGIARMRKALLLDYFFLLGYWLAFLGLSMMLSARGGAGFDAIAVIAALTGTLTALLDVTENIRTTGLLAIGIDGQVRPQPVRHLRATSLAKWAASSTTIGLLSALFLQGTGRAIVFGCALLGLAAVGLGGLLWNRLIEAYIFLFLIVGGAIGIWFVGWSSDVVRHL